MNRWGSPAAAAYRHVREGPTLVDAWALLSWLALAALGLVLATAARATTIGINSALVATVELLPASAALAVLGAAQVVYGVLLVVTPIVLIWTRHVAVLLRSALGLGLAPLAFGYVETTFALSAVSPYRSAYSAFIVGTGWPPTSALAAYTGAVVAASPAVPRRWRRALWSLLAVLALQRVVTATSAPLDVVLAIAVGGVVGSALLLVLGRHATILTDDGVQAALERAGLTVDHVEEVRGERRGQVFRAIGPLSGAVRVKVIDEYDWRADRLHRAYRRVRLRDVGEQPGAGSPMRAVVTEAMLELLANTRGVRTPLVRAVARAPGGEVLLASDDIDGSPLSEVPDAALTDELLLRCWQEVARLREAGLAHHEMNLRHVVLDKDDGIWLRDLGHGEAAAGGGSLAGDVAELLAATAVRVGPVRAVAAAARALGTGALAEALVRLVPAALSPSTQSALRAAPGGLQPLIDEVCRITGISEPRFLPIERVTPRTMIMTGALVAAAYLLTPQLTHVPDMVEAVRSADVEWLPAVLLASAATYVGAALGLAGGTPGRIPVLEALGVALASSFVATFTPPGVGQVGLNVRYLQKRGFAAPVAVTASAAKEGAVLVAHVLLLVLVAVWAGRTGVLSAELHRLPPVGTVAAIAGAALVVLGAVAATPPFRRFLRDSVLPAVRTSMEAMRDVLGSPAKLATLFSGVLLLPLGYAACLYCSLRAFGGDASPAAVGLVSLTAGTVATATPIPGGLGAVEAVLLAALTGLGIVSPVALATVFLYRVATFWLPIVPGAAAFRLLTRRQLL